MFGSKPIQFNDYGQIIIDEVHYRETLELFELLFKCISKLGNYTEADLDANKDICMKANAYKRSYNLRGQINRNPNSDKYQKIIKYLLPPKTVTGKGYSYWGNQNELYDRLQLLLAFFIMTPVTRDTLTNFTLSSKR